MKDSSNIPLKLVAILADGKLHSDKQLGVSRIIVNEQIQTLKSWGLDVLTVTGKEYYLPEPIELLNEKKINLSLKHQEVSVIPIIDSTNQYLLERVNTLKIGDACIAEYQQAGRGRLGRQWFSPFGTNLHFSIYWRLNRGPAAAIGLSLVIGIVIAEVLRQFGAKEVKVKWPNDLYLNDRKLAGVLVEMIGTIGSTAQIVLGAGINLTMRSPDKNIVDQNWINLQEAGININRNMLVSILINQLRRGLRKFEYKGLTPFITSWKRLDNFIDRPVRLLIGNREVLGIARGIDSHGGLLLDQGGITKAWFSGEISLRPQI